MMQGGEEQSLKRLRLFANFFIRQTDRPVEEYLNNRPLIINLLQERRELIATVRQCEEIHIQTAERLNMLELENQRLKDQAANLGRNAFYSFLLALLATIFLGLGVNLLTSDGNGLAIFLLSAAALLHAISFLLGRLST